MKTTPPTALLVLALLGVLPAAAQAQGGKIDEVERSARESGGHADSHNDGGDGCNFLCVLLHIVFSHNDDSAGSGAKSHADAAVAPVQTYGRYPWGGPRRDEVFVTRGPDYRPAFGASSVSWFRDASSTLGGMSFDIEGAREDLHWGVSGTFYREPKRNETDRLYSLRAELGGLGPMGRGYFTGGVGGRIICLDDGTCAGGLDLGLGGRVLPLKPLLLAGNVRVGGAKWHDGGWFWVTESNATASFLIGRVELGGGWHWLKLGNAAAFAGPVVIGRVWF